MSIVWSGSRVKVVLKFVEYIPVLNINYVSVKIMTSLFKFQVN